MLIILKLIIFPFPSRCTPPQYPLPPLLTPLFLPLFQDYDKYRHDGRGRDATKKLLLSPSSHSSSGGGGGGSTAMIQPPVTDIYLCDKCENEFYSLKEVQVSEGGVCVCIILLLLLLLLF